MRRLQAVEAMNYAEARGWSFVLSWDTKNQFTFTLGDLKQVSAVVEHLEAREMPVDLSKLSPNGNMIR